MYNTIDSIGSVDDAIEKNEEIIDKIHKYRSSYFNNFVNSIDQNSKYIEILDLINIEGGSQPPKSEHIYEYKQGYVRFIQNRDYSNESHITYIKDSSRNKLCDEYDIMIDKYGEAGKIRYGLAGAYNVALSKITVNKNNFKEFIRDYLSQNCIKELLFSSCQASTRASLNESTFVGIKVPLLDDKVMDKYEKIMYSIIHYELILKQKTKNLKEIKQKLLNKYFD